MMRQGLEEDHLTARAVAAAGVVLEPDDVARIVVEGLEKSYGSVRALCGVTSSNEFLPGLRGAS